MHQLTHQRIGKSLVVGLLLPLVAIVAAGTDPIAHAADQVVTSMTDGGEPGTLRAAFEAVNASGGGVITVPAGTITLTSALPALTQNTTVVGAGVGETIIDTDGYRFIYSTASVEIHVEAVTLTGNTSSAQGAMIYRQSGTTTLERVEVTGNSGASFLGIIFQQQGGVLQLVDSAVHNNAGGIFGSDHGNTPSDDTIASPLADSAYANRLYITSSVFSDNTGCVVWTERFITITDSTFTGNSAVCLGGLNRKTIQQSTFTGNDTAIHVYKNTDWNVPVVLDSVTITGNGVGVSGAYSTTSITNSRICTNGVDVTERSDTLNPQSIIITNSEVGASCTVPETTTTTITPTTTTTITPTTTTTITPTTTTTITPTTTTTITPTTTTTIAATTTTTVAEVTTTTSGTVPVVPTSTIAPVGPTPSVPVVPAMPRPLEANDVVPVTSLPAGDAYAIDHTGSVSPIAIQITDGRHVLSSEAMSISVTGAQPSKVGSTLVLHSGGTTEIDGTDFLAGSTVKGWLFSEPTLVGEVVANADGSFKMLAAIPATVASGSHTIVVSGVRADGNAEAIALGVTVAQPPSAGPGGTLPSTGASPQALLLAAFVLVALGTVLATRRRPVT